MKNFIRKKKCVLFLFQSFKFFIPYKQGSTETFKKVVKIQYHLAPTLPTFVINLNTSVEVLILLWEVFIAKKSFFQILTMFITTVIQSIKQKHNTFDTKKKRKARFF